MLEWTGERYLPYTDPSICGTEIHYEHLHRYAFTTQYVKGKKVLDLASGEGYGSFLLSQNAESVMGIDTDIDAVIHASKVYNKDNLTFLQGSIINIPIAGEKLFDIIVCFEAIEHIHEHEILLQEIKRLIKDDGLLIISTPNKKTYSDIPNYRNPFHVREIYYQDFWDLLKTQFAYVYSFGQRTYSGSSIFPKNSNLKNDSCTEFVVTYEEDHFSFKSDDEKLPLYFIAIATDKKLSKKILHKSFLMDISNKVISVLQNQINQGTQSIQTLNLALSTKEKQLSDTNIHLAELEKSISEGTDQITKLNVFINLLQQQLEEINNYTKTLAETLSVKETQLQDLTARLNDREQKLSSIEKSMVWQFTIKFHNKIVERLLPQNTLRRRNYDLGLKGGRILINDGMGKLYWHFNERRRVKKEERRLKKSANAEKAQYTVNICSHSTTDQVKFPKPREEAEVSIIVPVFNKFQYTLNCLKSISDNTTGSFEVVIVDDASTDETATQLKNIPNLTIIRNKENLGFVESCNNGAKRSKGKFLLFLNNDTVVTENWLPPLLEMIKKEDVGGVGAKLIYPNGTLQEAGGIIWNDASGWNYGRGDHPEKSQYNFVRDVDYCSGAALLVKRDLFERLEGFDRQFKPGYYEDADLCFSIRERGYRVLYQPLSVVIHFEGISNGTDLSTGIKKYQEINRIKFFKKWEKKLVERHCAANSDNVFDARIRRKGKKILVIDHYVPTWDMDAGACRMYNLLKLLVEMTHKVTFIGDNLLKLEPYTADLQQNGVEVIYHPTVQSIEEYLKNYGTFFDIVIISRPHIAIKHYDKIKKHCTHAKIIFDTVDLQYIRERRRAEIENDATVMKEAENSKVTELFLATHCDLTLVVSPIEKEFLLQEDPLLRIEVLSLIHEVTPCTTPFCDRKDLVFVGGFNHQPNVDAMKWFTKEIFPHITKSIPDIKLYIIGSNPTKEIERLASSNIIVVGYAKDLTPYFNNCRVFVAPLRYGAGVKGKINQSMSYGLPVVTTPIGAEGMNFIEGKEVLIAESPKIFAQMVISAYNDETLWNCLSKNSIINVEKYFSFDVTRQQIQHIINRISTSLIFPP